MPDRLTPSLELASDRWSDVTGGGYVRVGDYTLLNLQVQYRGSDLWEVAAGASRSGVRRVDPIPR